MCSSIEGVVIGDEQSREVEYADEQSRRYRYFGVDIPFRWRFHPQPGNFKTKTLTYEVRNFKKLRALVRPNFSC